MESFCVRIIYLFSPWDAGNGMNGHGFLIFSAFRYLFREVLERDCQPEASWCCKSFMQFHNWGLLHHLDLQVVCRCDKLFCAWVLFPAHLLAKLWFFKSNNTVWEMKLIVCLCLWSRWWGCSPSPHLYVLLPLLPDLVVRYKKLHFDYKAVLPFYAKQNVLQWY